MVIIPEGSTLAEDLQHLYVQGEDIIQKINACKDAQKIVSVNTRELQMLVEYRDLFDAEPIAIIGMQGAMYNTVWNTYVATMDRTTIDAFRTTLRDANDVRAKEGTEAIARPTRSARIARLHTPTPTTDDAPDESDFSPE
jgi:hypothetical protein